MKSVNALRAELVQRMSGVWLTLRALSDHDDALKEDDLTLWMAVMDHEDQRAMLQKKIDAEKPKEESP